MDELPVLMEKLRKAKNLRQLHLDLNKPGKEVISGGPSMTPEPVRVLDGGPVNADSIGYCGNWVVGCGVD